MIKEVAGSDTRGPAASPVVPGSGRLRPLGLGEVEITGGFWFERQGVNSSATLAHCQEWMERLSWVGNFRAAVEGRMPEARRGMQFSDSDVYKLMEAMTWEFGRSGSADANQRFEGLVRVIAPAQEEDGYLNTCFGRTGQGRGTAIWSGVMSCTTMGTCSRRRSRGRGPMVKTSSSTLPFVRRTTCVVSSDQGGSSGWEVTLRWRWAWSNWPG